MAPVPLQDHFLSSDNACHYVSQPWKKRSWRKQGWRTKQSAAEYKPALYPYILTYKTTLIPFNQSSKSKVTIYLLPSHNSFLPCHLPTQTPKLSMPLALPRSAPPKWNTVKNLIAPMIPPMRDLLIKLWCWLLRRSTNSWKSKEWGPIAGSDIVTSSTMEWEGCLSQVALLVLSYY